MNKILHDLCVCYSKVCRVMQDFGPSAVCSPWADVQSKGLDILLPLASGDEAVFEQQSLGTRLADVFRGHSWER